MINIQLIKQSEFVETFKIGRKYEKKKFRFHWKERNLHVNSNLYPTLLMGFSPQFKNKDIVKAIRNDDTFYLLL